MKKNDLKIVRQAASILSKDKKYKNCTKFCWGCWQCHCARLVQQFISFANDYLMTDEDIKKYFKDKKNKQCG